MEEEMGFKRALVLKIIAVVIGLLALLTAVVEFGTKALDTQPAPAPSPTPYTEPANQPQPPIYYNPPGDGPYYDSTGQRVDSNGNPCGGYNPAPECWTN